MTSILSPPICLARSVKREFTEATFGLADAVADNASVKKSARSDKIFMSIVKHRSEINATLNAIKLR